VPQLVATAYSKRVTSTNGRYIYCNEALNERKMGQMEKEVITLELVGKENKKYRL